MTSSVRGYIELKGNDSGALTRAANLLGALFKEIEYCDILKSDIYATLARIVNHEIICEIVDESGDDKSSHRYAAIAAHPDGRVNILLKFEDSLEWRQRMFDLISKQGKEYLIRVSYFTPRCEIAVGEDDEYDLSRLIAAAIRPHGVPYNRRHAAVYLWFPTHVDAEIVRRIGCKCRVYADRNGRTMVKSKDWSGYFVDVCDYNKSPFARKAFRAMLESSASFIVCDKDEILTNPRVMNFLRMLNIEAHLAI